jgi:hypothetical protein
MTPAAEAGAENKTFIAALKHHATQNQQHERVLPQRAKPS